MVKKYLFEIQKASWDWILYLFVKASISWSNFSKIMSTGADKKYLELWSPSDNDGYFWVTGSYKVIFKKHSSV